MDATNPSFPGTLYGAGAGENAEAKNTFCQALNEDVISAWENGDAKKNTFLAALCGSTGHFFTLFTLFVTFGEML